MAKKKATKKATKKKAAKKRATKKAAKTRTAKKATKKKAAKRSTKKKAAKRSTKKKAAAMVATASQKVPQLARSASSSSRNRRALVVDMVKRLSLKCVENPARI